MDLESKLIIKVQLNDEIRKMPIHNEDITYDELIIMMERVFKHKLSPNDEIIIRYKDEDSDLITISDDSDLAFAIQSSKILKLVLTVKTDEEDFDKYEKQLQPPDLKTIRKELQIIRDRTNKLLDKVVNLNSDPNWNANTSGRASATSHGDYHTVGGKEFDPLSVGNQSNIQYTERTESSVSITSNIRQDDSNQKNMTPPITSGMPKSQVNGVFNIPPAHIGGQNAPLPQVGGQNMFQQNVRGHNMPPQMVAGQHMGQQGMVGAPGAMVGAPEGMVGAPGGMVGAPGGMGLPNLPPSSMGGQSLPQSNMAGPNFQSGSNASGYDESAAKMPGYMGQQRPSFYSAGQARPPGGLNMAMPNGQARPSYFNPQTTVQQGSQMQPQHGRPFVYHQNQ